MRFGGILIRGKFLKFQLNYQSIPLVKSIKIQTPESQSKEILLINMNYTKIFEQINCYQLSGSSIIFQLCIKANRNQVDQQKIFPDFIERAFILDQFKDDCSTQIKKQIQLLYNITQNYHNSKMGFKANIDIALSFSTLKICSIRQQGFIKFRVYLYHLNNHNEQKVQAISCHPYSIIKHKTLQKTDNSHPNFNSQQRAARNNPDMESSELDSQCYLSKGYKIMFDQQSHPILETCTFRTYVDVEKYPDLHLKCQVELLFCPSSLVQNSGEFKTIGRCSCKIRKLFDLSTYLPIIFDEFEGVAIESAYSAALMDFHFSKEILEEPMEVGHSPEFRYQNFYEYLSHASGGFNRQQTRKFYHYYRKLLEKQLFSIQQRHYDLLRTLNQGNEDFRIIRLNQNQKIDEMIDHLGGYNSSMNDRYAHNHTHAKYPKLQSRQPSKFYYRSPSKKQFNDHSSFSFSDQGSSFLSSNSSHQDNSREVFHSHREKLAEEILHDYISIKALIFQKWSLFIDFMNENTVMVTERYKNAYDKIVKQRLAVNVFSHNVQINDWKKNAYEDCAKQHLKQTEMDKKKIEKDEQLWKEVFLIENEHFFQQTSKCIKIFEEIYPVHVPNFPNSKRFSLRQASSLNEGPSERNYPNKSAQQILPQRQAYQNKSHQHSVSIDPQLKNHAYFERKSSFQLEKMSSYQFIEELKDESLKREKEDHFVVLVHGYQASRQDFMVFKNCLQIRFSDIKVFISTCNQGRTEDSIEVLGRRFALELQKFINNSSPSYNYKLSFIGHSMGGLIVRTALCYLQNISRNLYSYISLSTPHLGYIYEPSTHIQAGLWVMKALQKSNSIQEICMKDQEQLRDTFLYRLSKSGSLNKFKHLAFVSSAQDKYIAFQSARIEQNQTIISEKMSIPVGQVIYQMIDGLLGSIESSSLSRIDVIFNIEESNFDTMIGRTAHIKYLSDRQFIKTFCIVFDKFFR